MSILFPDNTVVLRFMTGNQGNNTGSDSHSGEHFQTVGLYGFCRAAPGKLDLHLGFQLFDPGSSFDDLDLYGFEGGIFELSSPEHFLLEDMHQHICHRVQEQSELICLEAMTGRTVASQIRFMLLDTEFHGVPGTVSFFIQCLCPELNQVGNDVPDIGSIGSYLTLTTTFCGPGHDPAM
jgi:hypothetical protein